MENTSELALQSNTKNWGSFWKKTPQEKLHTKAMKHCCVSKGKPQLIGKSFRDLQPKEILKDSLKPIQVWPERKS